MPRWSDARTVRLTQDDIKLMAKEAARERIQEEQARKSTILKALASPTLSSWQRKSLEDSLAPKTLHANTPVPMHVYGVRSPTSPSKTNTPGRKTPCFACVSLVTEGPQAYFCPEALVSALFCPELWHTGEFSQLKSGGFNIKDIEEIKTMQHTLRTSTPLGASLDPTNGALTDKHLANLMLDTEKVCMQLCARLRMCVRYAQVQSKQEPVRYLLYTNQCVNSCSRFFSHP